MVLADVCTLELALMLGLLVRYLFRSWLPIEIGTSQYAGVAVGVLTIPVAFYWVGLYPGYGMGPVQRMRDRIYTMLMVFSVLFIWNSTFADHAWSRGVLLTTSLFAIVLLPFVERLVRKGLIRARLCGSPVIILGGGTVGARIATTLLKEIELGYVPVGILDDELNAGQTLNGVPVLGPLSRAPEFEGKAKVAIIAMPRLQTQELSALLQRLNFPNVIVVPNLFGMQTLWVSSRDLGGILGLEVRRNLLVPSNRMLKRALDCMIAAPVLILSVPLIAACALFVKMVSPGPVLFQQLREGADGEPISVLKLRTMFPDSERLLEEYLDKNPEERLNWIRFYKLRRDPRMLPGIGWFLRRSSLDELPQLWNILRGEMSLVGPRPFPYYHLDGFTQDFRQLRSSVVPGLTGLWQVSERSEGDLEVQEAQDTYYIRNWSLWLDLYILVRTVGTVLLGRGAY
jgi:Undecaprenyl-phosphate galactose phosphotransferase WbaP